MKTLIATLALTLAATAAQAQQTRFYDARGNSVGTADRSPGGQTRYYDARGNSQGTSNKVGNTTIFYNAQGTVTGKATGPAIIRSR
jgi:hypothetical protein